VGLSILIMLPMDRDKQAILIGCLHNMSACQNILWRGKEASAIRSCSSDKKLDGAIGQIVTTRRWGRENNSLVSSSIR